MGRPDIDKNPLQMPGEPGMATDLARVFFTVEWGAWETSTALVANVITSEASYEQTIAVCKDGAGTMGTEGTCNGYWYSFFLINNEILLMREKMGSDFTYIIEKEVFSRMQVPASVKRLEYR